MLVIERPTVQIDVGMNEIMYVKKYNHSTVFLKIFYM